jgi:hypothetical protein
MTPQAGGTHRIIRLEPLGEQHVAGLDDLALDPDVQRNTYVPEPPPPGGRTWLDA